MRSNSEIAEFSLKRAKAVMNIMKTQYKNVGVVTDLQDVKVNIDMTHVLTLQPFSEIGIQAAPDTDD